MELFNIKMAIIALALSVFVTWLHSGKLARRIRALEASRGENHD